MCHVCHAVVPEQKLLRCPVESCKAKRLQTDKPPTAPKSLIGKEALSILKTADNTEEGEDQRKKKEEEVEYLKKTIEAAKKYGFTEILEHLEKSWQR